MKYRTLVCTLVIGSLTWLAPPASASHPDFRYVDESGSRLPPNLNPPGTDALAVELGDVDGDGDLDIFVANGTATGPGRANLLYINDGAGHFTEESAARLPGGDANNANSARVDFADIDADGDLDAVVANQGPDQLLLNNGRGFFTDVSSTHLPPPVGILNNISADALFVDIDGDGDPDILVANENPFTGPGSPGAQNRLWINDGTGHFSDETAQRLPTRADQTTGFAVGDIDGDGDLDVIVVNLGPDFVLINDGNGRFRDETAQRLPVTSDASRKGILTDFDGDGDLDLFVANSRGQQSRVYFNDGSGRFQDVTRRTLPRQTHTTTDAELVDLDGDGFLDLFLVNAGPFVRNHGFLGEQNVYLRNSGNGRFHPRTVPHFPEVKNPAIEADFGDLDGDGDLDLVVANSDAVDNGRLTIYIRYDCHQIRC